MCKFAYVRFVPHFAIIKMNLLHFRRHSILLTVCSNMNLLIVINVPLHNHSHLHNRLLIISSADFYYYFVESCFIGLENFWLWVINTPKKTHTSKNHDWNSAICRADVNVTKKKWCVILSEKTIFTPMFRSLDNIKIELYKSGQHHILLGVHLPFLMSTIDSDAALSQN